MSVKVCSPFVTPTSPKLGLKNNNKKRPFSATATLLRNAENMIGTASAGNISAVSRVAAAVESNNSNNQLTAQQRREALKLSFQRSFSEPLGGVAGRVLGVPCTPTIESPPIVSPSLHPSKRCRMMQQQQNQPIPHQKGGLLAPPPPAHLEAIPGSISLPTSPCSESSTLQRTLLLKNSRTVDPNSLAVRIESNSKLASSPNLSKKLTLVVDCRPFIAYNVNHIRGAINVNCCDRFNRKRLQQGKATLADLATTKEGKELLKKRTWKEVFVYDECSESLENLPASHTLFLVMNALVEDHREPVMLLGGLRDFQVTHRGLCEDHLMHSNNHRSGGLRDGQTPQPVSPSSKYLPDLPSPSELCDTKDIENHPATQVLPHLNLGNMRDASNISVLTRLNIRYILNVTAKAATYSIPSGFQYKHLEAADNGFQNLRQFFEEAFEFIEAAKAANTGVLIHCQAGISRSPTIAIAYLMKNYLMPMAEAYKFVKTKRSIISPNLNFMGQLWEYEQVLKNGSNGNKDNCITTKEDAIDNQKSLGATLKSLGELKTPSTAGSNPVTPFSTNSIPTWSQQSSDTTIDGIYTHTPAPINGCSV
jgi:protein-tyrosine phosphatase